MGSHSVQATLCPSTRADSGTFVYRSPQPRRTDTEDIQKCNDQSCSDSVLDSPAVAVELRADLLSRYVDQYSWRFSATGASLVLSLRIPPNANFACLVWMVSNINTFSAQCRIALQFNHHSPPKFPYKQPTILEKPTKGACHPPHLVPFL